MNKNSWLDLANGENDANLRLIYVEQELEQDSLNVDALDRRCSQLILIGEYHKAIKDADKLISITPKLDWGYYNKGHALLGMMKIDEAIEVFKQYEKEIGKDNLSKYIEKAQANINQLSMYEKTKVKLPNWVKGWLLANVERNDVRTPEYLFKANQTRKKLLKILNNQIQFCLVDPLKAHAEIISLVEDLTRAFQLTQPLEKEDHS